ncbi:MAG: hypothetical protein BAJATHORv1_90010 [Candidatus Thorarchaeota archaeon]|nr:MAG: hypothetical protein BAJATHORv1_90010 [Candidatus Thorarchaeota archaeon]
MMTIAPRMVGDYPFNTDDATALVSLLDGKIGENLKRMMLDFYPETISQLFSDPEKSRLEALAGYANLQRALRQIQLDESIFSTVQNKYGSVIYANLSFSLKSLETLITPLLMSVTQPTSIEYELSDEQLDELTEQLRSFVLNSQDFPDATRLKETGNQDLLSELVMAFNIGLFIVLVFLVINLAKSKHELSDVQISEIETLLRDWSQEVLAQLTLFGPVKPQDVHTISLVGIDADEEDVELADSFSGYVDEE